MNLHIQYSTPIRNDICVAFCFFNPCGYVRPLQNLTLFEQKLRLANIPYYSIEMIIADKPPMLVNPTVRIRSKSSLFYKEALWNRLEKDIPPQYTKIVFLDSDIIFSEPNWLDKISVLLDSCDLVHPFETVDRLNLSYTKVDTLVSSIKETNLAGTGFGWAITREAFSAMGGFFDKGILGNGDTLFYNCILPSININDGQYYLIQDLYNTYRTNFRNINLSITYLNTHIYHLSHGTIKNRNYGNRHNEILGKIKLPWDSLFSLNIEGFWELTDNTLNDKMIEYFISRKEDSEEVDNIMNKSKNTMQLTQNSVMSAVRPMLIHNPIIQSNGVNQKSNNSVKPPVKPVKSSIKAVASPFPSLINLNNTVKPVISQQNMKPLPPIPKRDAL